MKTIYIAGKVTGEPLEARINKFQAAETILQNRGWKTINPIKLVTDPSTDWQLAMDICFKALKSCHCIYMLPCSENSKGAQLELQYAMDNNYEIFYELENVEA